MYRDTNLPIPTVTITVVSVKYCYMSATCGMVAEQQGWHGGISCKLVKLRSVFCSC